MSNMHMYLFVILIAAIALYLIFRDRQPVFASAEAVINAPIGKVWKIQTDLKDWSRWNPDIESMQVNGAIGVGAVFIWKAGGITIESTITEFHPNSRIAWKGKATGVDACHVWVFKEMGNATHVYTEETFTGIVPWVIPGTMRKEIDKALHHGIEVLKKAAEQQGHVDIDQPRADAVN